MKLPFLNKWLDNQYNEADATQHPDAIDWLRIIPFIGLHLACFGVIWVGVSGTAVLVCAVTYLVRMFAITAFYHRFFSHKSFKTSRWIQATFAIIGAMATQRGPIWWAAHHRHHHVHADTENDPHTTGWLLAQSHQVVFDEKELQYPCRVHQRLAKIS